MKRSIISFVLLTIVALTSAGRDRLYIEDLNIAAGETLQVPVILLNDTAYCGLQTDLYLPEGLSLDMDDDEYIIDLTSRKHSSHTVASRQLSDGAIRIYVSSISAKEFSGNSGAIMTLSITAANNFSGQAFITLKNSICAEAIGTRHVLDDEICTINPGDIPPIQGDVNSDGAVNITDAIILISAVLNGSFENVNMDNADVNGDGKINISDVTILINYLLNGTWPQKPIETQTLTVNGVSFSMVKVNGGTFLMGATPEQGDEARENEKPVHQVTLSDFYIGQTEVTQELWLAVMGTNPSHHTGDLQRPVDKVSWEDCQEFISRLSQQTGMAFRLPTEAEWEYAARGGDRSKGFKYAGSNNMDAVAWHSANSNNTTHPVATKAPNELDLYDMTGNVWEWCYDWYTLYTAEAQTDPMGPVSGNNRVLRGGCWNGGGNYNRISFRDNFTPTGSNSSGGLRLVLDKSEVYTVNGVSFTMVPVKSGTFMMGCSPDMDSEAGSNEAPVHQVTLSSYYIGQTEVTQELWQAVMGTNPSNFPSNPKNPVEKVTWNDCQQFITKLNELTGESFRLPTEAEWEFAARGGNQSRGYTYAGSSDLDEIAWYGDNSNNATHPVGLKKANELGLYDMTGNVYEWCFDRYGYYPDEPQTDPTGPETGSSKIYRGGSWQSSASSCRNTRRNYFAPGAVRNYLGLRLVK